MRHIIGFEIYEKMGVPDAVEWYAEDLLDAAKEPILDILEIIDEKNAAGELDPEDVYKTESSYEYEPEEDSKDFPFKRINIEMVIRYEPNAVWGSKGTANFVSSGSYTPEIEKTPEGMIVNMAANFHFNRVALEGGLKAKGEEVIATIEATIYHELNHAYEDFMRKRGKHQGLAVKSLKNQITSTMKEVIKEPSLRDFLHLLYISTDTEINARVPQAYSQIKSIKGSQERLAKLKNTSVWGNMKDLEKFSVEKLIAGLFDDYSFGGLLPEFLLIKDVRNRVNEFVDAIHYIVVNKGQLLINEFSEGQSKSNANDIKEDIEKQISDARKILKRGALEYFMFWEKYFHKKAEAFKRKLLRTVAI